MLEDSLITREVGKETPQGEVLSPLLWNLVINTLLVMLENVGCRTILYRDDVVLAVSGTFVLSALFEAECNLP